MKKLTLLGLVAVAAMLCACQKDDIFSIENDDIAQPAATRAASVTPSDWMSALDDAAYASQISIPGTHDAATSKLSNSATVGKTQLFTIAEQLEKGVRAFDLRPTVTRSGFIRYKYALGNIYHGVLNTNVSMDQVMSAIDTFLNNHPSEFVVCVMRNETGDRYLLSGDMASQYNSLMTSYLNSNSVYKKRKVDYSPDLTVGQMRGKILLLSRNQYAASPVGGAFIGWSHSESCTFSAYMTGAYSNGTLCVQDMFSANEMSSDGNFTDVKQTVVKKMLDYSAACHTNAALKNVWVINHCSGYTGTTNYSDNAAQVNLAISNYINGTEKTVGSTGILMMDFAGSAQSTYFNKSYTVNGDVLLKAVIDNNFRYNMNKEGE